jgi:sugar phosphate permease
LLVAATFLGLLLLPVDFSYWAFATLVALNGIGSGLFSAPNTSAVMSSVPASQRGVASGMRATAMNAGTVLYRYVHVDYEPAVVDDGRVGEVAVPPVAAEPEHPQRSAGASVSARLAP